MKRYVLRSGAIWLEDDQNSIHVCSCDQELAIAFDSQESVLLKHGAVGQVESWHRQTIGVLKRNGYSAAANVIEIKKFWPTASNVERMNAALERTGHIPVFEGEELALTGETVIPARIH